MSIQIRGGARRRSWWWGVPVMLAVAAGAWFGHARWAETSNLTVSGDAPARGLETAAGAQPAGGSAMVFRTGLEQLPRSLEGSEVNGAARVDAAGKLVVDRGLRELFDYFLSLLGEEPLAAVRGRLDAWLSSRLPAPARRQAMDLLDRYMAYQKARGQGDASTQAGTPEGGLSLAYFEQMQQRLAALRARHFSAVEVQAFFGEEIIQDRYVQERWALMADAALPPAEKARRLQALKEGMPESWREAESVAERHRDLTELSEDWKRRQGQAAELRQIRERLVGPEAADRLEALDIQRGQWTQRVAAWHAQSTRIRQDAQLSESQRAQALSTLRQQSFDDREWLRVEAMGSLPVQ